VVLAAAACAVLAVVDGVVLAQEGDGAVVTPSVQVTQDVTPGRIHTEPQMLQHPENRDVLVIAAPEFNTSTCHTYVSRDRGRTWSKSPAVVLPPGYSSCVRPRSWLRATNGSLGPAFVAVAAAVPAM
jgi:hypothetical protein